MLKLKQNYPFFDELSEEEIRHFLRLCSREVFSAGEKIITAGDSGDFFFLIVSGSVSVRLGEREVARLGPGRCFGEMGALEGAPRSATVIAAENAITLSIAAEVLIHDHSAMSHKVALILLKQLADKLREADRIIQEGLGKDG